MSCTCSTKERSSWRVVMRIKGKATFIAAALGSVYQKELLDGDRERQKKKDKQATIKWDDDK